MSDSSDPKLGQRPKGIPTDHPSMGKHVREPVVGPSWPEALDHGGGRMITPPLEVLWGLALAAWVLYSRLGYVCPYFKDPDAARLAFGVGQRLQGVSFGEGIFYQLEKQVGSYLVFEWLARLFGVNIAGLEHFMALVCALFMIGILALNYHLAHMIWGRRVALVSTTVLSISPMMWITGQYPTSLVPALFFFMLAVWVMVLSYRVSGGRWWLVASGLLFAFAALVRLDMLLGMLAPICYAHFVDRRGLRRALILYAITAVALIIVWFGIFRFIPADVYATSQPHQPDYPRSLLLNWWGMGPFLFVFAFAGFVYRFVTGRRPLPFIFFWIAGFNTFYTGHLYSPRYFIPYYPPVSWLAAFAIIALYGWLVRLSRYNRPLRLAYMALFILGALTMLTVSTIKDGEGRTRIAWGETISYARNHGLHPTGAVWYYMQNFRSAASLAALRYSWVEDGARHAVEEVLGPGSEIFADGAAPIYVGAESQIYVNYFLLANGWTYETSQGPFLSFTHEALGVHGDASVAPTSVARLQTVHVGDEPVPELGFLSGPRGVDVLLGREAVPRLISQEGEVGAPRLSAIGGWHVAWSFDGLDILATGPGAGASDGTIACERELNRFFYRDALPRWHVALEIPREGAGEDTPKPRRLGLSVAPGVLGEHDGVIQTDSRGAYLRAVSEVSWVCSPQPGQWIALAVNRAGWPTQYSLSVNGEPCDDAIRLASNVPGYGISVWDIILVPPRYFSRPSCEFRIDAGVPGIVYEILWIQRNYPDSQFRDEVARPLDLEFADIQCMR